MTATETGTEVPSRNGSAPGLTLTWTDVDDALRALVERNDDGGFSTFYGIPTGGAVVAALMAGRVRGRILEAPEPGCLVVDDLVDTGATAYPYAARYRFDALFRKPWSPPRLAPGALERDAWLRFPWEPEGGAPVDAVTRIIQYIGEDPTREGLIDTPARVVKAYAELTSGYQLDPVKLLGTTFEAGTYDEMITVRRIPFSSLCEHHLLPFTGHATVAYIPGDRIVGLSKIPRCVLAFAKRLQVQERLTDQIADAMESVLAPRGVGVRIEATHTCSSMRGVEREAPMVTTAVRGLIKTDVMARGEFLSLASSPG